MTIPFLKIARGIAIESAPEQASGLQSYIWLPKVGGGGVQSSSSLLRFNTNPKPRDGTRGCDENLPLLFIPCRTHGPTRGPFLGATPPKRSGEPTLARALVRELVPESLHPEPREPAFLNPHLASTLLRFGGTRKTMNKVYSNERPAGNVQGMPRDEACHVRLYSTAGRRLIEGRFRECCSTVCSSRESKKPSQYEKSDCFQERKVSPNSQNLHRPRPSDTFT